MKIEITSIEGNRQRLDGGAMFGNAPRVVWEKWLPPDAVGRIELACRSMLVEIGGMKILCEAGIGAFFEPKLAERYGVQNGDRHMLLEGLNSLGIGEGDIDYVVLSHLHFDHAGGILPSFAELQKTPNRLLFPKAQFVVGDSAFNRSQHPHQRDRASFIPGLSEKLIASGRLKVVSGKDFPDPIIGKVISFCYTDGHTPGQMHVKVRGEKTSILFCGDLVPGTHWLHLPITMGYDRFPEKLIDEKVDLIGEACVNDWLLFFTHDPNFAAAKCKRSDGGKVVPLGELKALVKHTI